MGAVAGVEQFATKLAARVMNKSLFAILCRVHIALGCLALIAGCKRHSVIYGSPKDAEISWLEQDVTGLTIELMDPYWMQWMQFHGNGIALVHTGKAKEDPVGPAYEWKLVKGHLRISHRHMVYEELSLISRDDSTIVVRKRSGKVVRYRILHPELTPPQRALFRR